MASEPSYVALGELMDVVSLSEAPEFTKNLLEECDVE